MNRRDFLRRAGGVGALMAAGGTAGCASLPSSGPRTSAFDPDDDDLEGLVIPLTAAVAERVAAPPPAAFPGDFLAAGPIDPTRLGVDDLIDILVWEGEGSGLFNPAGGAAAIEAVTVDPAGRVFVPFAGQQRAAGMTVAELREALRAAFEPLTLSPQLDVRLREPRSRLVTLQGAVARPGVYPIERPTLRLSGLLASAGGAADLPQRVEVAVTRHGVVGRQLLADVFDQTRLDIAMRPGDQVVLSPIRERFLMLGAGGVQAELAFPTRPLDLLSAIALGRGLNDFDADATGVFVLRYEDPETAAALLPGPVPAGLPQGPYPGRGRPVAYRLDMSGPEGLFAARRFAMRDRDAIFITNAPLTELRKFLQLFNAVVTPVNSVNALPIQ